MAAGSFPRCENTAQAIQAFDRITLGCENLEERVVPNITLSMPTGLNAFAGGIVAVPINVNTLTDATHSGVAQASFAINYDPAVFNINATGDVFLGTVPKSVLPSGPPATPPPGVPPTPPKFLECPLHGQPSGRATGDHNQRG